MGVTNVIIWNFDEIILVVLGFDLFIIKLSLHVKVIPAFQVVAQSYKSERNMFHTLCRILLGIWCTSASFVLLLYLHHLMVLGYDFLKWWHKHSYNIITILLNKTKKSLLSITKDVYRLPCFGDIVIDSRLRFLRKFSTLPLYFLHKASNCRITYKTWILTKISQWII